MKPIQSFLLSADLRIATNPCVSPDFCLDWPALAKELAVPGRVHEHAKSAFQTRHGDWLLAENDQGDCAWLLRSGAADASNALAEGQALPDGRFAFPASFDNLLALKNHVQEHDPESTLFPTCTQQLGRSTLGVGARFTTLHWPAVDWAMQALGLGLTANQNSIPRELVYDVDAMLADRLDTVPFPFIGTHVPEGHQGQSVEGMSHGCILAKLRHGFHRRRIAWSFNADHQPIGGKFDAREDALVAGCVLASYITFDLSPELARTQVPADPDAWVKTHVPTTVLESVCDRLDELHLSLPDETLDLLLATVWPSLEKMKRRDDKYAAARAERFTTPVGRDYLRELSIDELPGLTTPETTAVMLALCEALGMAIHFIAPAFGFQKNMPYPDNGALRALIQKQWAVCKAFGVGIGFHSGSGKSAENYQVMGEVTGQRLEIKTSGRYTYEMGRALFASTHPADQALWRDWYAFTVGLALSGCFSGDETERRMARSFVVDALERAGRPTEVFAEAGSLRAALAALPPSPEHMFWFEYNFLYVLAADGRAEKSALGNHQAAGYRQRARFYAISPEARLRYARNVAGYLIFLAENTGLASKEKATQSRQRLLAFQTLDELLADIGPA